MSSDLTPREILKSVFGYSQFREHQEDIINHVINGGDAFVLMPTSAGKSLCYQIPSIARRGTGVVISPLIALMQDQVSMLKESGVRVEFMNSSLSAEDNAFVRKQMLSGQLDMLYIAPERLMMESTLTMLDKADIALFAIDEAHCVSQWGHNFRADYLQLSVLHERYPQVPRIALTATADLLTRQEIIKNLKLENAAIFCMGFDRPNIKYRIVLKDKPKNQLIGFLNDEHEGHSGIIYCLSRRKTESIAEWLCNKGWNALPYHAGLDSEIRQQNQDRFLREDGIIIVATIAFGMGIDKPDIRFVAHLDLPKSIEAYYQETGRAGRDGRPADAWMAYGMADAAIHRHLIDSSDADEQHKKLEHQRLNSLLGLCETTECRRRVMLNYFGDDYTKKCTKCDTCIKPVSTWDATNASKKAIYVARQTGESFGVGYLTDIMLGKTSERMSRNGHDAISAFGKGKELSESEWASVFRQLVAGGYLVVDMESSGVIRITESGRDILNGKTTIEMRKDPVKERNHLHRKPSYDKDDLLRDAISERIFEALRILRLKIARENNVPPYVIFHDSTLVAMAQVRPKSLTELKSIPGIGSRKLESFGEMFIKEIKKAMK
ncbi:MAG: DNA helicase RecQ [Armatimonadota bacterium]